MGIRSWKPTKWDEEDAEITAMSLDQVHKKLDRIQKSLGKLAVERKRREDKVEELREIGQRKGTWSSLSEDHWSGWIGEVDKKMWKKGNELDKWDKIREGKVEEEAEAEEEQEEMEQEQEELEEAVAPTNYHIPWKEADLRYDNIKTVGWGTKEQRVKRMTVEQVDIKIRGCQMIIDELLATRHIFSKPSKPNQWYHNNKFWSKDWRKKVREKAEWEQIKAIKMGAKEDSINDYDEEEEQEKLNEILGQSYSERWGDKPSDTGDAGPQNISVVIDGDEELEKEMSDAFGDDFGDADPEWVYEDTRQGVKEADELLFWINSRLKGLKQTAGRVNEMLSEEINLKWLRYTTETIEKGIKLLEKESKLKDPHSVYEVKSKLEKVIRKGVRKLEKQRKLIEKKDIYDSWGLLKQYTSFNVNTTGTGSLTSRSSGLQFTIKKFRY